MGDAPRRLLSVVVPVFNEEGNVEPLCEAVARVMATLADRYDYELIFTDNHSSDRTFETIERLARRDPRIRGVRFSRNFGFQRSILQGYRLARGAAAIQLDCDLQDPPELILEFVRQWESGYEVVYGIRRGRLESWRMRALRKGFYRLVDRLSEDPLPLDAGDFRLVGARALAVLRSLEDARPYLRGTVAALGFEQVGIEYDRAARVRGESKFSFGELIGLAVDGILNHSVVPLRIATYTGLVVSGLTIVGVIGYVIGRVVAKQEWPAGFATTTVLLLLSISLNALFLGIIGEYLGRIYRQVKRGPLTVVERTVNIGPPEPGA